jgi:hypothetical protein
MKQIERNLKSTPITLIYNLSNTRFRTQLANDVLPSLNELLKSIPVSKGGRSGTLILHSSGGYIDVIGSFIYMMRKKFDKFQVAVPEISHSAATLLSFGADLILMNDLSSLSPFDPQIGLVTPAGNIAAPAEAIKGYYTLINNMFKDDSARIQAFNVLLTRFPPDILGQIERIQKQTEDAATKAFQSHIKDKKKIKEIVTKFQKQFFSHDYRIHSDEARKLGLKVQMMDRKLESLCSNLLKLYVAGLGGQGDLEIDIPEGEIYKELIMSRAYLECVRSSFSYKTKYRILKDKKVEVEELGWSKN